MSQYWDQQLGGFNQGINNLTSALVRRPQFAARQQLLQAEAQRQGTMMDEERARTGLLNTQAGQITRQQEMLAQLAEEVQNATTTDSKGRIIIDPKHAGPLTAAFIQSSKGGNDAAETFKNFTAGANAPVESDLNRQNKLDLEANKPWAAPNNSTIMQGTTPMGQAAATLAPGATRLSPAAGDDTPEVEGQGEALPPKSSAAQGALATAMAKVISDPKMDAKTKMGTISALKAQIGGLDNAQDGDAAAPAAALTPEDLTPVTKTDPAAAETQPAPNKKTVLPPWQRPQIQIGTNTPPEMASLLTEANKALANGADWDAVTNRLSTKYGISFNSK
jgi:hypothetical protein